MEEELMKQRLHESYKQESVALCDRLYRALSINKEEIASVFGGDIQKNYIKATEEAMQQTRRTRNKINHL